MPGTGIVGYQTGLTVSNSAIGLTIPSGIRPNYAFITTENNQIRFRVDGTDPTSSEGHIVDPGSTIELVDEEQIRKFKAIRTGAADAIFRITYFAHYVP